MSTNPPEIYWDNQYPGRDINPEPCKYIVTTLPTRSHRVRSVTSVVVISYRYKTR